MPELPEVETISYDLNQIFSGWKIIDFVSTEAKMLFPNERKIKKEILHLEIKNFKRIAKIIIISFKGNNIFLIIHLKMTGRLLIRDQDSPSDRWLRAYFLLKKSDQIKELRFCDQRKFGYVKLIRKKELDEIVNAYGLEPLKNLDSPKFYKILQKRKTPVKKLLMDQSLIAGIGNIYANDALYVAKIHPERVANTLTYLESQKLLKGIEKVLKKGLKYRGASDNSYLDAFGEKGKYQEHFQVYRKDGKKCKRCGEKIRRITLGGRGTFFCPYCQKY